MCTHISYENKIKREKKSSTKKTYKIEKQNIIYLHWLSRYNHSNCASECKKAKQQQQRTHQQKGTCNKRENKLNTKNRIIIKRTLRAVRVRECESVSARAIGQILARTVSLQTIRSHNVFPFALFFFPHNERAHTNTPNEGERAGNRER